MLVTTEVKYLAVGHLRGNIIPLSSRYPRKELLSILGASKAYKMYVDTPTVEAAHIGYIIGGEWYTLYKIEGMGIGKESLVKKDELGNNIIKKTVEKKVLKRINT